MAPAVLSGLGWVRIDVLDELGYQGCWSRQGTALGTDSAGQLGVCWSWTSSVPGPRCFGLPGPQPHFHRCLVVVGRRLADGPVQPQVVTTRGRGSVSTSTMPP